MRSFGSTTGVSDLVARLPLSLCQYWTSLEDNSRHTFVFVAEQSDSS